MRLINRLRPPGEIRSVRLNPETVIVRTTDDEVIVYRRIEDEPTKDKGAVCSLGKEFKFRRT